MKLEDLKPDERERFIRWFIRSLEDEPQEFVPRKCETWERELG